jgi:hypothetical protein
MNALNSPKNHSLGTKLCEEVYGIETFSLTGNSLSKVNHVFAEASIGAIKRCPHGNALALIRIKSWFELVFVFPG